MTEESKIDDIELQKKGKRLKSIEMEYRKHSLKLREQQIERQRVANESINSLLSVVKYLNAVQDGDALRIDATYSQTSIDKPSRILNCHEEDIMNASLITMKRLIESLMPIPKRPVMRHQPA